MSNKMTKLKFRRHNSTVLSDLQEGDQVEFYRTYFSHWGVYIGNEEIVHLSGVEDDGITGQFDSTHVFTISGVKFNKAKVVKEKFWDVTGESKAMKNNKKDRKCTPLGQSEIVKTALSKLGEIGYNVLWYNCEHFAAFCRYGKKWSEQVNKFLTLVAVIGCFIVAVVVYKLQRPKKDEEKSQQS